MTRKNFTPAIKAYLLTVLADCDHELENPTQVELIQYCHDRVYSEYGHMIKRVGLQMAIREWLQGLALNVEYTCFDIEQLLLSWGVLTGNETEAKLDKELDLYWDRLACNLIKLFNTTK